MQGHESKVLNFMEDPDGSHGDTLWYVPHEGDLGSARRNQFNQKSVETY